YEYYYDKFKEAPNDLQDLLIPITFELTVSEQQIVEEHRELFESFGIHFEPFGEKTYIVRSHPTWFPKGEEAETIRNIVDLLLEEKTFDLQKLREETAIMLACKRSIKANQFLTQDEMAALLQTLKTCRSPYTCPHGRPIMVHFSTYELKKMFKRVM